MIYVILLSALAFVLSFILNDFLFRSFVLNEYVTLIFIPSGVRVFCTLVFDLPGAIGIVLGSFLVSLVYVQGHSLSIALSMALVAGGAAFAARWLSIDLLKLDANLTRITFLEVVQVCLIFSAVSATSHQILYYGLGITEDFVSASVAMFAGDATGSLACLIFIRYLFRIAGLRRRSY